MNKPVLLLAIFLTSFLSSIAQGKFETQITDSIYKNFNDIGIDLKTELLNYEDHLLKSNQLSDNSGESYLNVFKQMAEDGIFPIQGDYEIKKLNSITYRLFTKGFYSVINNDEFQKSKSKVKKLQDEFRQFVLKGSVSLQGVAGIIVKVLNENDFEREIFRMYALHTFYFLGYFNKNEIEQVNHANFYVTKENSVLLDGIITPLDSIPVKMHDIRTKHKLQETDTCRINLVVEGEVKMGFILKLKRELKKCGALKIFYSSSK